MFWQSVGEVLCVLIGLPLLAAFLLGSTLSGIWTQLQGPTLPFWIEPSNDSKESDIPEAERPEDVVGDE